MDNDWSCLLQRLRLDEFDVAKAVRHACRQKYRHRATQELWHAVYSEVFIRLLTKLRADPSYEWFATADFFLGTVFSTAWRVYGPDIRDRNVKAVKFHDPATLPERTDDENVESDEWRDLRGLVSNCEKACDECLSTANEPVRQVFLLRCNGFINEKRKLTNQEIAVQIGVSVATARRNWLTARNVFRETCGQGIPGVAVMGGD